MDVRVPGAPNGATEAQPPRRDSDDPAADYRHYRAYHGGHGNGGGSHSHGNGTSVVTATMVSGAVAVLVLAAGWLGFMRGEIRSALEPIREDITSLQSAHGRLDDRVSQEVLRLGREKFDNSDRLEAKEDLDRRLDAMNRTIDASRDHGHLLMNQLNDLRERIRALESRLRMRGAEDPPT